jgi:hypothetical protein|tara:strand:- start:93 stop:236 length:144 start_codon:yes stop_codon:yes gene_type:complete
MFNRGKAESDTTGGCGGAITALLKRDQHETHFRFTIVAFNDGSSVFV